MSRVYQMIALLFVAGSCHAQMNGPESSQYPGAPLPSGQGVGEEFRSKAVDPKAVEVPLYVGAAVSEVLTALTDKGFQIRWKPEQVTSEMWEQLNRMYLLVREAEQEEVWADEPGAFVRAIVEGAHLFHGVTESTLSHDEGWHYIRIGRFIERATTTAAMLEKHFQFRERDENASGMAEYVEWVGLLRACGAFEAYCKHYTADVRPERIAEFLLLNPEFPRSVRFVADRIEDSLRAIARALGKASNGRPERFAGRLKATLNYGQIDEIMADSPLRYLENIRKQCEQVHAALYQTYITYSIEAAIAS